MIMPDHTLKKIISVSFFLGVYLLGWGNVEDVPFKNSAAI